MTIHYSEIQSDAGPFVFVRLSDGIDQSTHDMAAWAEKLSSHYFSGMPVAVHNRDEPGKAVLTVFPPRFYPAAFGTGDNLIGLAMMTVEDRPLTKAISTEPMKANLSPEPIWIDATPAVHDLHGKSIRIADGASRITATLRVSHPAPNEAPSYRCSVGAWVAIPHGGQWVQVGSGQLPTPFQTGTWQRYLSQGAVDLIRPDDLHGGLSLVISDGPESGR